MSHRSFLPHIALFFFFLPLAGMCQLETAFWVRESSDDGFFSTLYINGHSQVVRVYETGTGDTCHWGDRALCRVRDGYEARYEMGFSTYVLRIYQEAPSQLRVVTTIWYPDSTQPRVADYLFSKGYRRGSKGGLSSR